MTFGSFGSEISVGVMSGEEFPRDVLICTSVRARLRKNGEPDGGEPKREVEVFSGFEGERGRSFVEVGTKRLLASEFEVGLDLPTVPVVGVGPGAGRGSPLAMAINWLSVHESSWSSNPFQNGASRRSIYDPS